MCLVLSTSKLAMIKVMLTSTVRVQILLLGLAVKNMPAEQLQNSCSEFLEKVSIHCSFSQSLLHHLVQEATATDLHLALSAAALGGIPTDQQNIYFFIFIVQYLVVIPCGFDEI